MQTKGIDRRTRSDERSASGPFSAGCLRLPDGPKGSTIASIKGATLLWILVGSRVWAVRRTRARSDALVGKKGHLTTGSEGEDPRIRAYFPAFLVVFTTGGTFD
jgi:hypothetical protein